MYDEENGIVRGDEFMELSLSFNNADAMLIEKYAAERNMSVTDFVKHAVMKSVAEETERAQRSAAILAMEKKKSDTAGASPASGGIQPQGALGIRTDDIKNEAKKGKEEKGCVLHDAWKTWLAKTFGVPRNGSSNEMLLANAHQAFDEFLTLTAERLGREKSQTRFFSLCENIPLLARKKILSTVDPRQLAVMLSGFAFGDFKKDFQTMASAYNGKSDQISAESKESCIALFSPAGNRSDGIRKAVVDALDAFSVVTAPMVGKTNAVKIFMRLAQTIPMSERQKVLLAMSPQEFAEMLIHFLF